MDLKKTKFLKADLGMTRMEWVCTEMEEKGLHGDKKTRYIGCTDYTLPERMRPVFFIHKGQPPECFDFQKHAPYASYEKVAFAQIVSMNWDKLHNGDRLTFDDDMGEKLREWEGRIWSGGSIVTTRELSDGIHVIERKKIPLEDRVISGKYVRYNLNRETD